MKRNDFATVLAYVGMLAIAIVVGLAVLRPIITTAPGDAFPINSIIVILLAVLVSAVLNACLIGLGHFLGAKAGKYEVISVNILGFTMKRENGKKKLKFSNFDGLTGEVKIRPKDVEKSSLSLYIMLPLLFLLIEVVAMVIVIAMASRKGRPIYWLEVSAITVLTVAGMIFLYNIFPARLDSMNDGYLMMLTSKRINKIAYNQLLLAENAEKKDEVEIPVYEEVTDFTYRLNSLAVYRALGEKDYAKAIKILGYAISAEKGLSASLKSESYVMKLSLLFAMGKVTEANKSYEEISDADKRYIASLASMAALRCYVLVSGLIDDSESETQYALDKFDHAFKKSAANEKEIDKALLTDAFNLVRTKHPGWDIQLIMEESKKGKEEKKEEEPSEEETPKE